MNGPADKNLKGEGAKAGQSAPFANPLLQSTAAFAAAAAAGIVFQRQLASSMFGFFEAALGGAKREAKAPSEPVSVERAPAEPAPATVAVTPAPTPVIKVLKTKPALETKPKPVVAKAPVAKPVAVPKAATRVEAPATAIEAPAAPARKSRAAKDDLKKLPGVGPKLEQVLNGKGILRFADIAGWSSDDIQRFDQELGFDGRIGRDDWVGQAKMLAGGRKARK